MTFVEEILEAKIDEVFKECQDKRHITSGDISPLDSKELGELTTKLAEVITRVLDSQSPQFNMSKTLEVLEDCHPYTRGELVIATDSDEEHYIIETNDGDVKIPIEKCREV